MTRAAVATVSVDVPVDPATAFETFTAEIDAWWVRGPHSWNDPARATGMRIEPGAGGRWLEMWDADNSFEIGRVLVWEPGRRLVVSHHTMAVPEPVTEVEVRFAAIAGGTRVTLTHRGWQGVPPGRRRATFDQMQMGWCHMLGWFKDFAARAGDD